MQWKRVANFILRYLWKGGEPVQLTTVKIWCKLQNGLILIKYFITRTKKDSILNKSYSAPTWTMEKPGLKNEHLMLSKPDPNGSFVTNGAYLNKKYG
jgi:hypothetical protein